MFTHGKRPLSLWLGRLVAAGMLLALLVFMCSLRSPAVEVSAAEREEEAVLDSREEIFVTTSATLTSRSSAAEVTFPAGTEGVIRSADAQRTVETREETVAQLLGRLRMEVSPIEMVSVDLTADPIEIVIDSQLILYEVDETITPGEVVYVDSNILPTWCEQVVEQGHDGVKRTVYEVVYSQGQEVSRQLVEETDTEPVTTVIRRGTLDNFAPNQEAVAQIVTNEDKTGTIVLENGQSVTFHDVIEMRATAYSSEDPGVGTRTASGTTVRVGAVAVKKEQIPLGTKLYIVSNDGAYLYGFSIAEDTGGGIRENRIDLYFDTAAECIQFGVRNCTVYVLD